MVHEQVVELLERAIKLLQEQAEPQHINEAGLAIIKESEGLRFRAYRCPAGVWTIGYGHTLNVLKGDTCTEEKAAEWLRKDCERAEQAIEQLVTVPLTDNQFSALVSWVFNLGPEALKESTLLRKLNAAEYAAVPGEMKKWNKANGVTLNGLVARRKKEAALWLQA